ncbi:hypothetical protein NSS79_10360 [Paenibacillus sp. FSL L8-0436]|uniref:hypothetical protein n=1 Tax=Paenibacillus sp. FSL L8-0436 TaxID=2954686 RepID=UPI003158A3CB
MKFRKKPVLVDAVQYTPGLEDGYACYAIDGGRFVGYHDKATLIPPGFRKVPALRQYGGFEEISADDWIITSASGNRYVCKPEIFAQTYEAADGPPHEEEAHDVIKRIYESSRHPEYYDADTYDLHCGIARGIELALNTLGIKIEGVNADDNGN